MVTTPNPELRDCKSDCPELQLDVQGADIYAAKVAATFWQSFADKVGCLKFCGISVAI